MSASSGPSSPHVPAAGISGAASYPRGTVGAAPGIRSQRPLEGSIPTAPDNPGTRHPTLHGVFLPWYSEGNTAGMSVPFDVGPRGPVRARQSPPDGRLSLADRARDNDGAFPAP